MWCSRTVVLTQLPLDRIPILFYQSDQISIWSITCQQQVMSSFLFTLILITIFVSQFCSFETVWVKIIRNLSLFTLFTFMTYDLFVVLFFNKCRISMDTDTTFLILDINSQERHFNNRQSALIIYLNPERGAQVLRFHPSQRIQVQCSNPRQSGQKLRSDLRQSAQSLRFVPSQSSQILCFNPRQGVQKLHNGPRWKCLSMRKWFYNYNKHKFKT